MDRRRLMGNSKEIVNFNTFDKVFSGQYYENKSWSCNPDEIQNLKNDFLDDKNLLKFLGNSNVVRKDNYNAAYSKYFIIRFMNNIYTLIGSYAPMYWIEKDGYLYICYAYNPFSSLYTTEYNRGGISMRTFTDTPYKFDVNYGYSTAPISSAMEIITNYPIYNFFEDDVSQTASPIKIVSSMSSTMPYVLVDDNGDIWESDYPIFIESFNIIIRDGKKNGTSLSSNSISVRDSNNNTQTYYRDSSIHDYKMCKANHSVRPLIWNYVTNVWIIQSW